MASSVSILPKPVGRVEAEQHGNSVLPIQHPPRCRRFAQLHHPAILGTHGAKCFSTSAPSNPVSACPSKAHPCPGLPDPTHAGAVGHLRIAAGPEHCQAAARGVLRRICCGRLGVEPPSADRDQCGNDKCSEGVSFHNQGIGILWVEIVRPQNFPLALRETGELVAGFGLQWGHLHAGLGRREGGESGRATRGQGKLSRLHGWSFLFA